MGRKFFGVALTATALLAMSGFFGCSKNEANRAVVPANDTAFINARWGMSQSQVELSNGRKLIKSLSPRKFYSVKKGILNPSRYQAMQEESGRHFLGRDAEITYVFFDDRLFAYYVFVSDRDPESLDQDMRRFLTGRFSQNFIVSEDDQPLKMIWSHKDIIVNYWFFKVELNLSSKTTASYGVIYRPIEEIASN